MRVSKVCAGLLLAGTVIYTGCNNTPTATPTPPANGQVNGPVTTAPTTVPTETAATLPTTVGVNGPNAVIPAVSVPTTAPTAPETAPSTPPPPVVVAKPAVIVATHVLTKDQPYFTAVPASPTAAPDGTFKAGTKVLVFSFSGTYAKVKVTNPDGTAADDGTTAYTATDGIDPISKK